MNIEHDPHTAGYKYNPILFNNYLISEHYVSELIYVTLSLGANSQP